MKLIIGLLFTASLAAYAQTYSTGLPMPGLPNSTGQKTMANSTSVTIASDQPAIQVTGSGSSLPVTITGKGAAYQIRNNYLVNPIAGSYVQLTASTAMNANQIEIFDSSGATLSLATGGVGVESQILQIFPGGNGPVPIFIPSGSRLSAKVISGTATSGELDINAYN